jgi:hypothetical protein
MDVVIAGGHGQIALRLARLLSARGERVRCDACTACEEETVRWLGAQGYSGPKTSWN